MSFGHLAYVDWKTDQQKGAQYAYDNIMKQIHPGAILLLHTVSKDNADALENASKILRNKALKLRAVS